MLHLLQLCFLLPFPWVGLPYPGNLLPGCPMGQFVEYTGSRRYIFNGNNPIYVCLSMSPEANKIMPCDVTTHQLTLWCRHFSIWYEFYASAPIQTIVKTESASFSWTNVVWTYAVIFWVLVSWQCRVAKNYPGNKLPGYPTGTRGSPTHEACKQLVTSAIWPLTSMAADKDGICTRV